MAEEYDLHRIIREEFAAVRPTLEKIGAALAQYRTNPAVSSKKALLDRLRSLKFDLKGHIGKFIKNLRDDINLTNAMLSVSKSKEERDEANARKRDIERMLNVITSQLQVSDISQAYSALDWIDREYARISGLKEEAEKLERAFLPMVDETISEITESMEALMQIVGLGALREKMNLSVFELKRGLDEVRKGRLAKLTPQQAAGILKYCRTETLNAIKIAEESVAETGRGKEEIMKLKNQIFDLWNKLLGEIGKYFESAAGRDITGKINKELKVFRRDFANGGALRI